MGARTSVLPDLLSQASPATPPRHDRSTSEEVRIVINCFLHISQQKNIKFIRLKKRRNFGLVLIAYCL